MPAERPRRVLLDTNVWVSALIAEGPAHRIVQRWLSGESNFEVVLCPRLIDEIRDVLTRPKIARLVPPGLAEAFVDQTLAAADTIHPDPVEARSGVRDPDDDYLIALARATGADVIVTGDRDLLEWPDQQPPVVTPSAFEEGS